MPLARPLTALLLLLSSPAGADIFSQMTGTFGVPPDEVPEESCSANPVFSAFSSDRGRVQFTWAHPVPSYTGTMITAFGSTVMRFDDDSITMLRDNETRLNPAGQPVLWEMRRTTKPDGYCWHRSDWPDDAQCLQLLRCPVAANS